MQVKPLYQTQKRPVAKKTAQVGKPADKPVQHSKRSQRISDHYHAHVAGGTKAIDRMNPTTTPDNDITVSAYPGLTN